MDISRALLELAPGASWSMNAEDYNQLEWLSPDIPKPTRAEVEAEVKRLQEEYEYNQYQRDRKKVYPSIEDQLDLLYHQGYEGWKQEIDRVKEMHPKPNS
jgi:hypothetical protein